MKKAIIFDLWETLGTKNIGIGKTLRERFNIENSEDFLGKYENAIQLTDWDSEQDMSRNFLEVFGLEISQENIDFVIETLRSGIENATLFPGMEELLLGLKRNYKIGLISNTTKFESVVLENWGISDIFDSAVFSWNYGLTKPSNKLFDISLNELGVSSEEALFVDDTEKNIEGARIYGLNGIQFQSVQQLKESLKDYEVNL